MDSDGVIILFFSTYSTIHAPHLNLSPLSPAIDSRNITLLWLFTILPCVLFQRFCHITNGLFSAHLESTLNIEKRERLNTKNRYSIFILPKECQALG